MKKTFVLLILLTSMVIVACRNHSGEIQDKKEVLRDVPQQANNIEKTIPFDTSTYSIRIPEDWQLEKNNENTLVFKLNNNVIGGIDVLGYVSTDSISQLLPNHTENAALKKLEDFANETYSTKLTFTPPAASEKETSDDQIHYYFIDKAKERAFDLYVKTELLRDEKLVLQIAKSFKLK